MGFTNGYSLGFEEHLETVSFDDGFSNGFLDGNDGSGQNFGFSDGFSNGFLNGYSEEVIGFSDGFSTGFLNGFSGSGQNVLIKDSNGFTNGFSNGFDSGIHLTTYINLTALEPEIITSSSCGIPDWDSSCNTESFWDVDDECHMKDSDLHDHLQMDMYNMYGIDMLFYVSDFNTAYDPIFGEDNDRHVLRAFEIMTMFDLPQQSMSFEKFGIFGIDQFHIHVNKTHFSYSSTFSGDTSGAYSEYKPMVGDILCMNSEDLYYEIIDLKDKQNQFMQKQYSWDMLVRPFRDNKMTLSPEVSSFPISAQVDIDDILEINDEIDIQTSARGINMDDPSIPNWW